MWLDLLSLSWHFFETNPSSIITAVPPTWWTFWGASALSCAVFTFAHSNHIFNHISSLSMGSIFVQCSFSSCRRIASSLCFSIMWQSLMFFGSSVKDNFGTNPALVILIQKQSRGLTEGSFPIPLSLLRQFCCICWLFEFCLREVHCLVRTRVGLPSWGRNFLCFLVVCLVAAVFDLLVFLSLMHWSLWSARHQHFPLRLRNCANDKLFEMMQGIVLEFFFLHLTLQGHLNHLVLLTESLLLFCFTFIFCFLLLLCKDSWDSFKIVNVAEPHWWG